MKFSEYLTSFSGKVNENNKKTTAVQINESSDDVKAVQALIKSMESKHFVEPVSVPSNGIYEMIWDLTKASDVKEYAKEAIDNAEDFKDDYDDEDDFEDMVTSWEIVAKNAKKIAASNAENLARADLIRKLKAAIK